LASSWSCRTSERILLELVGGWADRIRWLSIRLAGQTNQGWALGAVARGRRRVASRQER
jgi:hypothetical protein